MTTQEEVQTQAGKLLNQIAGYVGVRTMQIGVRSGLLLEIGNNTKGVTASALAENLGFDDLYVDVWCRSAFGAEIIDVNAKGEYTLAPVMDQLLLNQDFPGWVGGIPLVLDEPEIFDIFEQRLESGQRTWWNEVSPDFITGVGSTGRPFYTRMILNGFSQVPGLSDRLDAGASVAELACGAGTGLIKFANEFPKCSLHGVDGDDFSLRQSRALIDDSGVGERVTLEVSTFEDWSPDQTFDMIFINISMHECRDIDKTTQNVLAALKPGGYFVISDMPFPETTEECRTIPARIMCGIQFWEAQIGDQLLPTSDYVSLLEKHGFADIGAFDLSPVHCVVHGRKTA